jgi:AraC-like DNA-binding protein
MTRDIIEINNFIVLIEYSFSDKTRVEKCELNEPAVGFAFYGSGNVELEIQCGNQNASFSNTSGMAISFFGTDIKFTHTISHKTPLRSITVFSTVRNFQKLAPEERALFAEQLGSLLNPAEEFVKGPHLLMTPEMKSAVSKIFSSTYRGASRLMFLKSQVTELLSHFIANINQEVKEQVSVQDQEKLYHAKEILSNNIAAPPTLNELSRVIGLNSNKLKKNFKELFGVPVFKHLQNERLTKAHNLLREGNTTIQEAAWEVGYESLSSFSNAFVKKFGFRPSEITK